MPSGNSPKASKSVFQAAAKQMKIKHWLQTMSWFSFLARHVFKTSVSFGPKVWRFQHQGVPEGSLLAKGCLVAQWDRYPSCESPLHSHVLGILNILYPTSIRYRTGNISITNSLVSKKNSCSAVWSFMFFGGWHVIQGWIIAGLGSPTHQNWVGTRKDPPILWQQEVLKSQPSYTVLNQREEKS